MGHEPPVVRSPQGRGPRLLVVAAAVVGLGAGAALVGDALRSGPLEPRDPSSPGLGVLAGTVAEVPPPYGPQRPVVLGFTSGGVQHDVATRQGGAFALELPPGTYAVTAASGQGVCPSRVEVHAGAWQRNDLLWPCVGDPAETDVEPPPAPPGAPPPPGERS